MKRLSNFLAVALLLPALHALPAQGQDVNLNGQRSYATGADNFGIYAFNSLASDHSMTEVRPLYADPTAGGVLAGNTYYCFSATQDDWGSPAYYMYVYDASDNFNLITRATCSSTFISDGQLPAYNPVDKKIYVAYSSGYYGMSLGVLDVSNRSRSLIGSLSTSLVAMTFDATGNLYGVTTAGYLYRINPSTADMSYIGSTGVSPDDYSQSACVSPDGTTIYWAAYVDEQGVLYKVNTTTGRATKIKRFDSDDLLASLWIDSIIVSDDAPSQVSNLSADFPGGALQGIVSFTLPTTTHGGAALSEAMQYEVSIDDVKVAAGNAQAGEAVSCAITVTDNGKHDICVVCSNNAGQGDKAEIKGLFIGKDIPGYATDIHLRQGDTSGELILTWEAPAAGVNGGYFDANEVKYRIRRMPDYVVVSEDATSPFAENFSPEVPQRVFYEVIPYVGEVTGLGMPSNKIMVGTPYSIPYNEDFSSSTSIAAYTIEDANDNGKSWEWQYEFGYFRIYNNDTAKDDWIFTPFIHLEPGFVYTVAYDIRSLAAETVSVWLCSAPGSDGLMTPLVENAAVDTDYDWETRTHDFSVAAAGNYHIGWHANTPDPTNALALYLDNVAVSGIATSIGNVSDNHDLIRLEGNRLYLTSGNATEALVSTADGRVVYSAGTAGVRIELPAGLYIVRFGNCVRKLIVR